MEAAEGLRERKKLRTREAIIDAALELFDRNGFEQTTIADIAARADIAPRTFFGYFPSKEDVAFADFPEHLEGLSRRLEDRPEGETAIAAMRSWISELVVRKDFDPVRERCRDRLIANNDALDAHQRQLMGRFETVLAKAIARDLGEEPDGVRPRMVAAAAVAAMQALEPPDDQLDPQQAMAIVEEAMTFLDSGIEALRGS